MTAKFLVPPNCNRDDKHESEPHQMMIKKIAGIFLLACTLLAALPRLLSAQSIAGYNHPELEWRTGETEHFFVHFHQGEDRTARAAVEIAESVYDPVIALYGYRPDGKIHLIIKDYEDDSNGGAFYYDNKIEIWASAMDFALRGTHAWLTNVVTHELSHMISLGAARKGPRQVPAVYLQWLGYEKEKRPDVIHGYPNRIVSYPIAGTVVPMWFAEGMAQFQRAGLDFDTWDSHRDMLLRTAVLEGKLLTPGSMSVFGKNSIGNERVYNQGYGLTLYIAHRFGEEKLNELARAMKAPLRMGFGGAVEKVLKRGEADLYREWTRWLAEGYGAESKAIQQRGTAGKWIEAEGSANFTPAWSPDGSRLAYVSNRGRDYLSQTSLWLFDAASGKHERLVTEVEPGISWSPDGKRIAFSRRAHTSAGSRYFDCYLYTLSTRREKRITRESRFRAPDWSPDGKSLIGVVERDGTSNLALIGADGKRSRILTSFSNGEQIFDPKWLGGDGRIVFSIASGREGRDIAEVDTGRGDLTFLVRTRFDERDPFPGSGGKELYYASDSTGIFDIYRMDLRSGKTARLTGVTGGAFSPAVRADGRLAYSGFAAEGFRIAVIDSAAEVPPGFAAYASPYASVSKELSSRKDAVSWNGAAVSAFSPKPYKPIFSKLAFLPRLMVDFPNKPKFGTYFYGSDFLDRYSVFGGAAVNGLFDTDAFLTFEYKTMMPTLFIEGYHVSRHTSKAEVDYRNTFLEADIGADWPLGNQTDAYSAMSGGTGLRTALQISRYDAAMEFMTTKAKVKIPYTYHKGSILQFKWMHRAIPRSVHDIAPVRGRQITFEADAASQRFMTGFAVQSNYGTLIEVYRKYDYFQFFLDWTEYVPSPVKGHSFALRLQAGAIDRPVDSFYNFFGGGLEGMRGYSYYGIEGRKLMRLGLAYRFPIFRQIDRRLLWLTVSDIFGILYGDAGNAWDENKIKPSAFKRDVGAQLRVALHSFYSFPAALFFDGAYGLDRVRMSTGQTQGKEWRFYFGILFDFID
jgi:Tol biopolymer transport system component